MQFSVEVIEGCNSSICQKTKIKEKKKKEKGRNKTIRKKEKKVPKRIKANFKTKTLTIRCNKKCRQFRQRKCDEGEQTCNQSVLRQERACRKGRCKRKAFHVVLPPKRESLKQPSQSDVRVLLSLNSIFYSSWSRWTPCTKLCTTNRHR